MLDRILRVAGLFVMFLAGMAGVEGIVGKCPSNIPLVTGMFLVGAFLFVFPPARREP